MKARFMLYMMLLLLLHGVMWTSCSGCLDSFGGDYGTMKVDSASGVVYDKFIALPDRGWEKSDSAVFELPLFERDADLDVTICVRHTNRYPYQNLQLVAFLAELDTSNIINSLPIRKNDDRIDSLIHRQDSLRQEKAQTEQRLAERKAMQDSLGIPADDTLKKQTEDIIASKDSTKTSRHKESSKDSLPETKEEPDSTKKEKTKDAKKKDKEKKEADSPSDGKKKEKQEKPAKEKASRKSAKSRKSQGKGSTSDSLTHVIEFQLFDNEDETNGSGMMFVETNVPCGTIHLKANTRYKIFITHNMKESRLKGISDIGIELKGCKKQPIDKMSTKWWDKQKGEN